MTIINDELFVVEQEVVEGEELGGAGRARPPHHSYTRLRQPAGTQIKL